jgi:UDP:flavonoid glycosyltransferase YjiC (YdhE family)
VRVLYYALGGGHGHVLRGLALLRRLGHGTLLGPAPLRGWADALGVDYLAAPEPYDPGWPATLPPPALLLVDVFPRGVVAELTPLLGRGPAWLVTRTVSPAYYLHPPVRDAIVSAYEQLVWTEAPPPALRALPVPQREVPPVLLRPPALGRDAARHVLAVPDGPRLLVGLGSGDVETQARLCRLLVKVAARLDVALRFVSAELPAAPPVVRVFPVARVLAAADLVVAAGGYHAVLETLAAGVPTVFVPQRRRYDDQWGRVAGEPVATDPFDLEAKARRLLAAGPRAPRDPGDGATALARLVQRRVEGGVLAEEEVAPVA